MPNWIEGNMKVRGSECDVFKFFSEGFSYYDGEWVTIDGIPQYISVKDESKVRVHIYDDGESAEVSIPDGCHIDGTRRAFCMGEDIYFDDIKCEDEVTKVVPVRQAWGWVTENYVELSKKYNIDIKLIGWEMGMEYKGELLVLRGKDPEYSETTYDDWYWETECPTFGG